MRLSVIIPVYNAENFIGQCLQSILDQDLSPNDYEVIVVDDGSIDTSASVVNSYAKKHGNIVLHQKKNGGVSSARNKGIDIAKGKYLYFIDPDDYLASGMLKRILDTADSNNLQIITFSSKKTKERNLLISDNSSINVSDLHVYSGVDYIAKLGYHNEVWWYLVDRNLVNKIGLKFILGRWMEDAIFTAMLFLRADRMAYFPIDAHRYVTVEDSAMTSKKPEHYIKVIYDLSHAAKVFDTLIQDTKDSKAVNNKCITRLKERQHAFVFFMMVRMLKSTISFNEVKTIIDEMSEIDAYPMYKFANKEHKEKYYVVLKKMFNYKYVYYCMFLFLNPVFKHFD